MNLEKLKVKTKEVAGQDQVLDNDPAYWVAIVTIGNIVNNPIRTDEEKTEILQKIKLLLLDNEGVE